MAGTIVTRDISCDSLTCGPYPRRARPSPSHRSNALEQRSAGATRWQSGGASSSPFGRCVGGDGSRRPGRVPRAPRRGRRATATRSTRPKSTPAQRSRRRSLRRRVMPGRPCRPRPRLVGRPVADQPAHGRSEHEPDALDPRGREREPHGVEVGACDHREAQGARHAPLVGLAVLSEREHRLDQLLELERRADLARESGLPLRRRSRTGASCRPGRGRGHRAGSVAPGRRS